ncbi:UPF0280 family protein [Oceanibacterium hippocampi]|uniref:Uncharacterized protein n=1 Tax=Oceanibacterium hippocampi TaxID=745714 RepID=A0A1Y5SIZ7_9PROT|nr:UPF0280 family protein [Oceanibacterium hippocampi]SLN38718.1 hypothetical protein OCH7691_01606 [Oceanibacterium hippocampi]
MSGARAVLMADGRRLHLQHGPIDIVAEAFGPSAEIEAAYAQAAAVFGGLLGELVGELDILRSDVNGLDRLPAGAVARRMVAATLAHRPLYVTPMAAVAGAVAERVLAALVAGRRLERAYVNNGGDIALHLTPGTSLDAAIVANQDAPAIDGRIAIPFDSAIRGIATSGWRGRSLSFGIADAVTVLARDAPAADVAATLIANAVNIDHPAVRRAPAEAVRDESELGARLVTVAVGPLPDEAVARALASGAARAEAMRRQGLIEAASLVLQGKTRIVGDPAGAAVAAGGDQGL